MSRGDVESKAYVERGPGVESPNVVKYGAVLESENGVEGGRVALSPKNVEYRADAGSVGMSEELEGTSISQKGEKSCMVEDSMNVEVFDQVS